MTSSEILSKPSEPIFERSDRDLRALKRHKVFVITSAQNNTPVEGPFFTALQRYCEDRQAALLVVPIRYRNPTSRLDPQDSDDEVSWPEELGPHLIENELILSDDVVVHGDVRIQATARRPLSTLESRSRSRSAVFGASQLSMQTVATPHHVLPKLLYSTGSVSQKNYSNTKQGNLASFHHSHSAVVIELCGKRFHLREITWDGESFVDLGTAWSVNDTFSVETSALITGDTHQWFTDPAVTRATYGKGGLTELLKPKYRVLHDLIDSYSISHHHLANSITMIVKSLAGMSSVEKELTEAFEFVDDTTPNNCENVIVDSNHHDHLTFWLRAGERGVSPCNAEFYHWLKWQILKEAKMTSSGVTHPNPFELASRGKIKTSTRFLTPDESFRLHGVELALHGHHGPNGARGSLANLSKIGSRFVMGHVHSPGIFEGGYAVGTSSRLRLEYNAGPSSWLQTHCALFSNGKRQLLHLIGGRFYA